MLPFNKEVEAFCKYCDKFPFAGPEGKKQVRSAAGEKPVDFPAPLWYGICGHRPKNPYFWR